MQALALIGGVFIGLVIGTTAYVALVAGLIISEEGKAGKL